MANSQMFSFVPISRYTVMSCVLPPVNLSMTNCLFIPAGGNGYINDYPTGRFLRDAKLYEIGAGTSEVRRIVLGRAFNNMYLNK